MSSRGWGVVLVGLAIGVGLISREFPDMPEGYPGPALFPQVLAILMVGSGIALMLRPRTYAGANGPFSWSAAGRLALGVVGALLFIPTVQWLGIGAAAGVVVLACALALRIRWWTAIVTAALTGIVVHGLLGVLLNIA